MLVTKYVNECSNNTSCTITPQLVKCTLCSKKTCDYVFDDKLN